MGFLDRYRDPIYALTRIVKKDGDDVTGRVTRDTGKALTVATNPYDPKEQTTIAKTDIKQKVQLKVSPMPPGLVNILSRAELLDLLAFLLSRGNPQDEMFHTKQ